MITLKRSLRLALLFLILTSLAMAQEITGSIEGTITDSQGGRVAGATVQVSGNAYNRAVTTDEQGFFRLLQVPPGRYTLTVTAANFGTTKQEQLEVVLGRATVTELALNPAQVTEQVVVTGSDSLVIDPTNSARSRGFDQSSLARRNNIIPPDNPPQTFASSS